MPNKTQTAQRPITEQIEELKAKISLLEGDRKAYHESSQGAIKNNKEEILSLRKETKELRQRLKDRLSQDAHVIGKVFHNRPVERAALSRKSGPQAIVIFDHKVCDAKKLLDAKRYKTGQKQRKLAELQTQYEQMTMDSSDIINTEKGESADAQTMRYLENSYDKVMMKTEEAKQVRQVYLDIKDKFEVEAQDYPNRLDAMETEMRQTQAQLLELQVIHNDAELSKETAVNDLKQLEETVYAERKKREIELQKMKKEAEEKKMQHERIEKRLAQRGSIQHDDLSTNERSNLTYEDHQQKITTYEEAFKEIKECTGISDTMEVVVRFENQGDTTKHLEQLKKDNERQIIKLREEKKKLQQDFEEMKYSGEAKMSSGQIMLEEFQAQLAKEEERRDVTNEQLQKSSRILTQVKAGIEHLAGKLHHLKVSRGHVLISHPSPTSNEYVLDQLQSVEEKLLKLLEELEGKDLPVVLKQMEDEDFQTSKLPAHNTRIKLPTTQRDLVYDDEEDSGEDDTDVPNRATIKKQSQIMVDSKTKKRAPKKKKKA